MLPTLTNDSTLGQSILAVALKLSARSWKIALSEGRRDKPSTYSVSNEDAAMRLAEAVGVIEARKVK